MARSYGWNSRVLIGFETEYGIAPATTAYNLVPFASSGIDSEQGLVASNVLGLGRDPSTPFRDVINVDGDVVVPVDLRNIGFWLKALLGNPTTIAVEGAEGYYRHTFVSGNINLPSMSVEVGLPEIPDYPLFTGVRANSIAFDFQRSGEAQATINLMGQGETAGTVSRATDPSEAVYTRFSQFQGSISRGGLPLADVTTANLTYSNNLERIETIRDDGKVEGIDPGIASLTGSITSRYSDTALMDIARAGTPIDLELAYTLDPNQKLQIIVHEVYLPKPKRSISGPGGIETTFDFQGAKNALEGKMMSAILTSDVASYV